MGCYGYFNPSKRPVEQFRPGSDNFYVFPLRGSMANFIDSLDRLPEGYKYELIRCEDSKKVYAKEGYISIANTRLAENTRKFTGVKNWHNSLVARNERFRKESIKATQFYYVEYDPDITPAAKPSRKDEKLWYRIYKVVFTDEEGGRK